MADGITITAGSGTTILTDDTGAGGHAQVVKLAISTDGSGTLIPADTTNGIDVDVTRVTGVTTFTATADTTMQNAVSATANGTSLTVTGYGTAVFRVTGTFTATVDFEASVDAGANWYAISAMSNAGTLASQVSSAGLYRINCAGIDVIRARVTWTSGTSITVIGRATSVPLATNTVGVAGTVTVGSHAVTNAGTFATQVDGSALTSLQLIDDPVFADDAAFTIGTSKVMVQGGVAVAHGSNPDAADALDAGAPILNRHRVPFVIGGHPNVISYAHSAITTAVTDSAMVTISAGSKIVVTRLSVTLDSASTVFPSVKIGFGTSTISALGNNGIIAAHGGVPAGGGFTIGDGSGILAVGADNEDLRITTVGNATGNGVQVSVSYYTIES